MVDGEIFLIKLIFSGFNKADGGQVGKFWLLEHSVVFLGTSKKDFSNDCVAMFYARVLHVEETRC